MATMASTHDSERRVAVVTGGASGIGRATARRLSTDGLAVVVWDIEAAAAGSAERPDKDSIVLHHLDVTDPRAVQEAATSLVEERGHVDVLVNCVGGDIFGLFLESDESRWRRLIDFNFVSVLNTCRYLAPVIAKSPAGRIVQIASDAAKVGAPLEAVYSGAKAAVISFSRALAREIAGTGTTVNCVSPGPCDTPLLARSTIEVAADPRYETFFPGGLVKAQAAAIPLGRIAQPEDVANVVSFLVQASSGYVTGQTVSVSGGATMS